MNSYCFLCLDPAPEYIFEVLFPEHSAWDTTHYCEVCFASKWLRHKRGIRPYVKAEKYKCTSVKAARM